MIKHITVVREFAGIPKQHEKLGGRASVPAAMVG
jgi:hypothetical protein